MVQGPCLDGIVRRARALPVRCVRIASFLARLCPSLLFVAAAAAQVQSSAVTVSPAHA